MDQFLAASSRSGDLGPHIAAGDFNNDGHSDLVIGGSLTSPDGIDEAGQAFVLYGSDMGFDDPSTVIDSIHQDTPGILGTAEEGDKFGAPLVVGNFNGDAYDDLAIGVRDEDVVSNTVSNAGAVAVLYGSGSGLTANGDQLIDLGEAAFSVSPFFNDKMPSSLAAGDFNCDSYDDLAMGISEKNVFDGGTIDDAGLVVVVYGSDNGLDTSANQL